MKKKHPKDYPTLHLRVPGELIPRIDALADRDNRTRSGWIVHKLTLAVENDELESGLALDQPVNSTAKLPTIAELVAAKAAAAAAHALRRPRPRKTEQ